MATARRRFLINRTYSRLWFGQATSTLGDFVFSTTLVLWVATDLAEGRSWAPAAVGGIQLSVGAAVLVFGPLAGVFVDRWDPLRTMLGTEVVRGGLVALLTAVSLLPRDALPVWAWLALLYVVVFGLTATGQFFAPARFATIRETVPGEADRARAAGIAQATAATVTIAGPPLAAPLMFGIGFQWALVLNAVSYAVSYAAIRSVRHEVVVDRAARAARPGLRAEFAAGLKVFAGSPFLVALLAIAVIGQLGVGAVNTLNLFFLTGNLGSPAGLYGFLGATLGIGGIVGALCAGRVVQWIGARTTTWVGLIIGGVLLFVYSRQTGFAFGVVALFATILPITILNTAMSPLLLAAAPQEYTGRVFAVFYPVTRLASVVAATAAGWFASVVPVDFSASVAGVRFGQIDTVFAVSAVLLVLAGLYARVRLPHGEPAAMPTANRSATAGSSLRERDQPSPDREQPR
ncbi:MFS transporter [Actinokineospora fastidiosa]|uniref:MFS transporter n=1 Tax=Actinokineospora fastidiosa TaxID=1816 RepID=A0A918LGI8_9PSEU|nr:MFS transporter [Actinokineospora fastidiosa]GGS44146.1 MFS transporter [Actinokineospora fastidiosa]